MNTSLMLALIFAILGLAIGMEQAMRRVRAARKRQHGVMVKKAQQLERLRLAARESLNLGREVRNQQRTADLLSEELIGFEEEMRQLAKPENRIFVLDEKRGPLDRAWIVTMESAGPQPESRQMPPWVGDRRFRVWAADEAGVRVKAERRYPPDAGYTVQSIYLAEHLSPAATANSNG